VHPHHDGVPVGRHRHVRNPLVPRPAGVDHDLRTAYELRLDRRRETGAAAEEKEKNRNHLSVHVAFLLLRLQGDAARRDSEIAATAGRLWLPVVQVASAVSGPIFWPLPPNRCAKTPRPSPSWPPALVQTTTNPPSGAAATAGSDCTSITVELTLKGSENASPRLSIREATTPGWSWSRTSNVRSP